MTRGLARRGGAFLARAGVFTIGRNGLVMGGLAGLGVVLAMIAGATVVPRPGQHGRYEEGHTQANQEQSTYQITNHCLRIARSAEFRDHCS